MRKSLAGLVVVVLSGMPLAHGAEPLTFERLDKELSRYKGLAKMKAETNSQCSFYGLSYYALFDSLITVLNDPKHPQHDATKQAYEANAATFKEQSGFMVGRMCGLHLQPLLFTTDAKFAKDFAEGAKNHAPNINPDDYTQPGAVTCGEDDEARPVAWFHGEADSDGDGVTNADELLAVAPHWRPVFLEDGSVKEGTGLELTGEQRDAYIEHALGVPSWRKAKAEKVDAVQAASGDEAAE